jgi:hypothetical protein
VCTACGYFQLTDVFVEEAVLALVDKQDFVVGSRIEVIEGDHKGKFGVCHKWVLDQWMVKLDQPQIEYFYRKQLRLAEANVLTPQVPPLQGPMADLITWLDDTEMDTFLDKGELTLNELNELNHREVEVNLDAARDFLAAAQDQAAARITAFPDREAGLPQEGVTQMPASVMSSGSRLVASRTYSLQTPGSGGAKIMLAHDFDDDEDDAEEVPSDKEGLPRGPPLAFASSPLMRPHTPELDNPAEFRPPNHISGYCASPGVSHAEGHNEEEEWLARQRLTGAIGRLVKYAEGDRNPKDDILGLRSTRRGRIMVTALRENGAAMKAGVSAGDELVSINGRKDFAGHPAHVVHASLRQPVTLVFLGFVGKLQAEVRVKRPPEPTCGLAPGIDVMKVPEKSSQSEVVLCDAVVFQPRQAASLLITTGSDAPPSARLHRDEEPWNPAHRTPCHPERDEQAPCATVMYELQREEARNLVFNSLYVPEAPPSSTTSAL